MSTSCAPTVPSYLPELLDLAWGTGRRISAILTLRYEDVRVSEGAARHDSVARRDRQDGRGVVGADQHHGARRPRSCPHAAAGIGGAYLFPSPRQSGRPISKDLASDWLRRAEALAKVPTQDGPLWHAYRRGWATARKHLPVQGVMQAGGWKDPTCLQTAYQQPDVVTLYRVVSEPMEIREAQA